MGKTETKLRVLTAFLTFARRYTGAGKGIFVTMGGEGIEARLWKKAGIPPRHGYLIERGRSSGQALLREYGYCLSNDLASFARTLTAIHGAGSRIDSLHLDLCGTLECKVTAVQPLVPLVVNSEGRCLAITVSDQRGNRALAHEQKLLSEASRVLGESKAQTLMDHFMQQQMQVPTNATLPAFLRQADPRKGALRELSLFLTMLSLLGGENETVTALPDAMERYLYVSRWSHTPFRMRSYFFHLATLEGVGMPSAALALKERWVASPLQYIGSATELLIPGETPSSQEELMYEKLQQIAEVAGGPVLAEFKSLLASVKNASALEERLRKISVLVNGTAPAPKKPGPRAELERHPEADAPIRRRSGRKLEKAETTAIELNLLRAASKSSKDEGRALEQVYAKSAKALGISRLKKRRRILGAHLARTQGKFRGRFVASVLATSVGSEEAALKELAALYSKIDGKHVAPDNLREEARAAK